MCVRPVGFKNLLEKEIILKFNWKELCGMLGHLSLGSTAGAEAKIEKHRKQILVKICESKISLRALEKYRRISL